MSLNDWILPLHELSAFALVASMVLCWILVLATRSLTDVDRRITFGRVRDVGGRVIGVGFVGTIVFGLWLSFSKDDHAPWDGWMVAAIMLWVIGLAARLELLRALAISSLATLLLLMDMSWKPGA